MPDTIWRLIAEDYASYCENTRPLNFEKDEWPGWEGIHLRLLKGKTCLNRAYIAAKEAHTVEDHLLYARILYSMNREYSRCPYEHEGFRFYVEPGWEQVKLAIANGQRLTARELAYFQETYEALSYETRCTTDSPEQSKQALEIVEGLSEVTDFEFHDSKPIRFEHGPNYALLTLEYNDIKLSLEFDAPYDIQVNGDPSDNWINDFYCYRSLRNSKVITFDVGFYRIICTGVRVKSV